jgi:Zn-dependent membrane protease YugP
MARIGKNKKTIMSFRLLVGGWLFLPSLLVDFFALFGSIVLFKWVKLPNQFQSSRNVKATECNAHHVTLAISTFRGKCSPESGMWVALWILTQE